MQLSSKMLALKQGILKHTRTPAAAHRSLKQCRGCSRYQEQGWMGCCAARSAISKMLFAAALLHISFRVCVCVFDAGDHGAASAVAASGMVEAGYGVVGMGKTEAAAAATGRGPSSRTTSSSARAAAAATPPPCALDGALAAGHGCSVHRPAEHLQPRRHCPAWQVEAAGQAVVAHMAADLEHHECAAL